MVDFCRGEADEGGPEIVVGFGEEQFRKLDLLQFQQNAKPLISGESNDLVAAKF